MQRYLDRSEISRVGEDRVMQAVDIIEPVRIGKSDAIYESGICDGRCSLFHALCHWASFWEVFRNSVLGKS